jgi:thioesterase domain-containing protein
MLAAIQTNGKKPPLYFVHGLVGVMPIGRVISQHLGADQPFYAINAPGMDGRAESDGAITVARLAYDYADDISRVQPHGPLLVGGMCVGCLIAMNVIRELQSRGRQVGPAILADPPTVPPGSIPNNHNVDLQNPLIASQLYERVRGQLLDHAALPYNEVPFDPADEKQVHGATQAGIASLVACATHRPEPFYGPAGVILSIDHAPGFFHPQMHWIKLLKQPPRAHVLPTTHRELFRSNRVEFARIFAFMLQTLTRNESPAEYAAGPAFATV